MSADIKDALEKRESDLETLPSPIGTLALLPHNKLGFKAVELIAVFLKTNSSITSLLLTENNIGCRGAVLLSQALLTNTTLTKLDIRRNAIQTKGIKALADMLKINFSLKELCYVEQEDDHSEGRNQFFSQDAVIFATALQQNRGLTCVNLAIQDNAIVTGLDALASGISKNKNVVRVTLSISSFGIFFQTSLANVNLSVSDDHNLFKGLLSYIYGFGNNAAITLTSALRYGGRLKTLDLRSCYIGTSGAEKIAQILPTNRSLTSLNLSDNYITSDGIVALLQALQRNYTLKSLYLHRNISSLNRETAVTHLQRNKTLTKFSVDKEGVSFKYLEESFPEIMERNKKFCEKAPVLNWGRASILIAFIRANKLHAFQYSVLPLVRSIMQHLPEHVENDTAAAKANSAP